MKFFYGKVRNVMQFMPILVVVVVLVYAWWIGRMQTVEINTNFYFLVSQNTHVETSTELVKLDGGAGYLLKDLDCEYVAFSVYRSREEGEIAQKNLTDKGANAILLQKGAQRLAFRGVDKIKMDAYISALNTFNAYMGVLDECIYRLERGMTQEAGKRLLGILKRQYQGAEKSFAEYVKFADICQQSTEWIKRFCTDVLYTKDLRYLQCWQAEQYLALCEDLR